VGWVNAERRVFALGLALGVALGSSGAVGCERPACEALGNAYAACPSSRWVDLASSGGGGSRDGLCIGPDPEMGTNDTVARCILALGVDVCSQDPAVQRKILDCADVPY